MQRTSPRTVKNARTLRRSMTLPEVLLWQALRLRPDSLKFRRQHPAGPYVLDFYCDAALLGLEVDGEIHGFERNRLQDEARDVWLRSQGVEILRIPARAVLADLDAVVRLIIDRCIPLHQPAAGPPPLQGGIS
ncbi:MAG: DUF559 domain-containing protein [Sphingomonas sp.]|uniref:endonuclease domain-containing protein n=1 Tax=Sphingomonas sp. TaxID=28214 RepID=UPI0018035A2B|nr:endonuclease domain-containing protein [Sphingomonas sp.]MBA3666977.1 DUF559 domain-containing protein [Sphingomonas sp.]